MSVFKDAGWVVFNGGCDKRPALVQALGTVSEPRAGTAQAAQQCIAVNIELNL